MGSGEGQWERRTGEEMIKEEGKAEGRRERRAGGRGVNKREGRGTDEGREGLEEQREQTGTKCSTSAGAHPPRLQATESRSEDWMCSPILT